MKRKLAETLYNQPSNMVLSAFGGIAASSIGATITDDPAITAIAVTVCIIALTRLAAVLAVPRTHNALRRHLISIYEIGAFIYATAVGLMAALAIERNVPVEAQLVLIGFAVSYGAGIAARNAGNPGLAIGQLFLAVSIPIAALAMREGANGKLLAAALAVMFPAMASVTTHIHRVLRQSVTAAEANARLAEKMKAIARTDVLTGLLNRAGLNHELAAMVSGLTPGMSLALFWMDLDRFKEVNDSLGHQTGDRLLAEVAARLRRLAPEGATIARFGGDEFILACEVEGRPEVQTLAYLIIDEVTRPIRLDDHSLEIGGSLGIALLPEDGRTLDELLQAADLALYHSKAKGKRQANFFTPEMTQDLARRRSIEAELRLALQRDELTVHFQPIIDLQSGRIRSFEALIRWFHPERGEIPPDAFIPVAEESGVIITLGNWLTAKAASIAADWPEDVTLAVNLSPLQIKAPGSALGVLAALQASGLDPNRLEIEITESILLEQSPNTEAFITDLRARGIHFALDDFGTGYSSLASLNAYPFSRIKVDRSFVSGVNAGRKSDAIIRAVSSMASTLDMEIVAEGIETAEQAEAVRLAGCTLGQGYHFSRAVPAQLVPLLLERNLLEGSLPEANPAAKPVKLRKSA